MDHLRLPLNPTCPPPRVRYVARPYDGGPFLEYPDRHPVSRSASVSEFEAFVQTWLYYGLLHEVLGAAFDSHNYIRQDESGLVVWSGTLYDDLDAWVVRTEVWSPQHRNASLNHLASCLDRASIYILYTHGLDQAIRQSLAALGEAVSEAIVCAADEEWDGNLPSAWISMYDHGQVHQHMRRHGWCPAQIVQATELLNTVDAFYFVERLSKPYDKGKHQACSYQVCLHAQIDPATYRVQHQGPCECTPLGPSPNDVMRCLNTGTYPLLRITGDTVATIRLEVVPYRHNCLYVALSHVWSHGLGNPESMQLPRCQMLQLKSTLDSMRRDLASGLDNVPDGAERSDLLLWCDTLCCPVEAHLKPVALEKMREVYRNSTYVLVLDQSLTCHDAEAIGLREASARLVTSAWTGRLWTLQEAALANKLLIKFSDCVLDVKSLIDGARECQRSSLHTHAIDGDLLRSLLSCTGSMLRLSPGAGFTWRFAVEPVRFRQASNPSDEALCLATILGLDLQALAHVEPDQRMQILWTRIAHTSDGIPQDIIFNCFRRLDVPGLRWAPASLIGPDAVYRGAVATVITGGQRAAKGTLTHHGFKVAYPAVQLYAAQRPEIAIRQLTIPFATYGYKVQLRHSDSHWYEVSHLGIDGEAAGLTLWQYSARLSDAILVVSQIPEQHELGGHGALLTSPLQHSVDGTVLRTHLNLVIQRMSAYEESLWKAATGPARMIAQELIDLAHRDSFAVPQLTETFALRCTELAQLSLRRSGGHTQEDHYVPRTGVISEDPVVRIATIIAILCTGQYWTSLHEYPADTQWTID